MNFPNCRENRSNILFMERKSVKTICSLSRVNSKKTKSLHYSPEKLAPLSTFEAIDSPKFMHK